MQGLRKPAKRRRRIIIKRRKVTTENGRHSADERARTCNQRRRRSSNPRNQTINHGNTFVRGHKYDSARLCDQSQAVFGNINAQINLHFHNNSSMLDTAQIVLGKYQICENPISLFESLSTFFPEVYTLSPKQESINVIHCLELRATVSERVVRMVFLYHKNPRHCSQLTATITVKSSSRYSHFVECRLSGRPTQRTPRFVLLNLERYLKQQRNRLPLHNLSMLINDDQGVLVSHQPNNAQKTNSLQKVYFHNLKTLLNLKEDPTCRIYAEANLIHRPVNQTQQSLYLMAFIESEWVLETRLSSDQQVLDQQIYSFRLLYHVGGNTGLARFIGIVMNDAGVVTAFLSELPAKGPLENILYSAASGEQPISLQLRELWCSQIVQAVNTCHQSGFVLGNLAMSPGTRIGIDKAGNAKLYQDFRTTSANEPNEKGTMPPEIKTIFRRNVKITPELDIYQLGLRLWRLLGLKILLDRHYFCQHANCTTPSNSICKADHTNPTALPMKGAVYPSYLRSMIDGCRSSDPIQRLRADKLITFLPKDWQDFELLLSEKGRMKTCVSPEDSSVGYGTPSRCDMDSRLLRGRYYHCNTCFGSNFDLCHDCFLRGVHCLDERHFIRELSPDTISDRAWSSIQPNGQRLCIEVGADEG